MSEIPQWLELQWEIEFYQWQMRELYTSMQRAVPRSPLARMIDAATGHDAAIAKKALHTAKVIARRLMKLKTKYQEVTGEPTSVEVEMKILALKMPAKGKQH